jgi:hypothetical protein
VFSDVPIGLLGGGDHGQSVSGAVLSDGLDLLVGGVGVPQ